MGAMAEKEAGDATILCVRSPMETVHGISLDKSSRVS